MPLRIQCPNGCIMRVPSKRAGMSARCPGCKSVVVVPYPPTDYRSGELLLASFSTTSQRSPIDEVELPATPDPPEPAPKKKKKKRRRKKAKNKTDQLGGVDAKAKSETSTSDASTSETSKSELAKPKPKPAKPADLPTLQPTSASKPAPAPTPTSEPVEAVDLPPVATAPEENEYAIDLISASGASKGVVDSVSGFEITPTTPRLKSGKTDRGTTLSSVAAIEKRTQQAQADRVTLTRFFAGFLVFVGLVNLGPAVYCWWEWSQADTGSLLPRWIYLQIFAAVLHIVYAILLLQVPDWATLQSIAFVMLVFAFVFGLFSMGLVTSGSNGMLAQFLQVPGSLRQKACIWCVAMLVLATLASYLAGRESTQWQRTEKLLAEVLAKNQANTKGAKQTKVPV